MALSGATDIIVKMKHEQIQNTTTKFTLEYVRGAVIGILFMLFCHLSLSSLHRLGMYNIFQYKLLFHTFTQLKIFA